MTDPLPNKYLRRWRKLYCAFVEAERINRVSEFAALTWFHLIGIADDCGRFRAEPARVLAKAFPHRRVAVKRVWGAIRELADVRGKSRDSGGLLVLYYHGDDLYGQLAMWEETQPVLSKNGKRLPEHPGPFDEGSVLENPENPRRSRKSRTIQTTIDKEKELTPCSPPRGDDPAGSDGEVGDTGVPFQSRTRKADAEGTDERTADTPGGKPPASARAIRVWETCSWRRVGRQAGLRAIERALKRVAGERFAGDLDAASAWLEQQARAYASSVYVRSCPEQYLPHPSRWFNAGHYDDDPAEWSRKHIDSDKPKQSGYPPPAKRVASGLWHPPKTRKEGD